MFETGVCEAELVTEVEKTPESVVIEVRGDEPDDAGDCAAGVTVDLDEPLGVRSLGLQPGW